MKKTLSLIVALVLVFSMALSLSATACAEEKIIIGFSPMTLVNEYFSAVLGAVEKVCE